MSTREGPQLSRLAPLDETARAPRVKTSVIKQWAGLCPSNGSRTICRNAKDFVRRDPVFSAFRYVRSWVRPDGLDEDRSNPNNQRAVDAAGEFVREHHSWRRRAEQVFDHLANGAAIDLRSMQSEPRLDRTVSRVGLSRDLPQELRTTERFG